MSIEEFIKELEDVGYSYEIVDKVIVTGGDLDGDVYLIIDTLPPDVVFNNKRDVVLRDIVTLPSGVEFNNGGLVSLDSVKKISPSVQFNNRADVYLLSLIGGWIYEWRGNIEGIYSKRLLRYMIKKGIFSR
jgi:hypothetical protein